MKRAVCILIGLIALLSACGQHSVPTADAGTLWQEQYDLGVRYLSEGNYEEAIIAFSAAIEIDPKRPEAYIGLADACIGVGDYAKASEAIAQGQAACGDDEAFDRILNNLSFLQSGESGIQITSFYFDRDTYLSGKETDFLVSVAYRCPEDEDCILMIGANTKEPHSFAMMDEDYQVTGSGGYQFHVSVTPVQWEEFYFGIYVNLSEANHAETWTPFAGDVLYIDPEGNVTTPLESNDYGNGDSNQPTLLSTAVTDNMLQFEEINFLGHSIIGLDIETMKTYMRESGMYLTTNNDLDPNNNDDYWWVNAEDSKLSFSADIDALQYKNKDYVSSWGYYAGQEERKQFPIGIRDIYTFETLGEVLTKMGFSHVDEIIDYINQIRKEEYTSWDEISEAFNELSCYTDIVNFSFWPDGARVLDNGNFSVDRVSIRWDFYDYPGYSFTFEFGWSAEEKSNDRLTRYTVDILQ